MKGYSGTLGAYILQISDMLTRQVTDREFIAPRLDQIPLFNSFLTSEVGGGLQEQFYNLRRESDKYQATVNRLKRDGRTEELNAYMINNQGLASTRKEINKIDRYLVEYRKTRREIELSDMISPSQKKKMLLELDRSRNIRLAYMPELKEMSDVPSYIENLFRN